MRYVIIGMVVGWFLPGCVPQIREIEKPVYTEVAVPVPCEVTVPEKPEITDDMVETNLLIMKYVGELETALKRCIR